MAQPQTIGRYEVRDRLGEGAFGVVYKAWDPQFEFEVAIKLCKPLDDGTQSAEAVARFKREARTAAQLQHPNIVPVRDMGSIRVRGQVQPYFVMPFIPGTNLADEIKTGKRFSDAEIVQLVSGIAAGLQYAHEAGLVHRDIKPANVMLDENSNPLIADFGMVYAGEASQAISQAGQQLGTPAYMPPEQVKYVPGEIDGRADIYSLGVVLYELLCNDIPYHGPAMSVMFNIVNGTPYPKPSETREGVNPHLEAICLTAMAHAKENRYAAENLVAALQSVLAPGGTLSPPRLPPQSSFPPPSRRLSVPPPPALPATTTAGVTVTPPVEETLGRGAAAVTINTGLPAANQRPNTRRTTATVGGPQNRGALLWKLGIILGLFGGLALCVWAIVGGGQERDANDPKVTVDTARPPELPQNTPAASSTPEPQDTPAKSPPPEPKKPEPSPVANTPQKNAIAGNSNPVLPIPKTSELPGSQFTNSIGMQLKLIPAGEFLMGSSLDAGFSDEHPPHRVRITKPFHMGVHEVTIKQFEAFVNATGYKTEVEQSDNGGSGFNEAENQFKKSSKYTWQGAGFAQTDDHPVVSVSWNDAVAFCAFLSKREGKTYRLPTEAEWEYACRAGTTTSYQHGTDPEGLAEVGNIADASFNQKKPAGHDSGISANDGYVYTAPVGRFRANTFGLSDMHGNVWEWCSDRYDSDYYKDSAVSDPQGPGSGSSRVLRGGSWSNPPVNARSAYRRSLTPDYRNRSIGFRVVRE